MKVGIYGRVSTEEQAQEGFSIAAQKEKLTAYAHSQDWEIYEYYIDEGISAKNTDRPALQRLLQDVRNRRLDVVLVYKLDRLTRSVLDLYQLLQEFDRYDVKFKSATEVYDTTTAIGRLFITLVAALAQWERENLAERVRFGQEQMVHEQKRPGGRPPFGYDLQQGTLVINPQEAPIVREIYAKYLDGAGLEGIARDLNNRGITTKAGNRWSKTTVQLLLQNPVYYGSLRWNYAKGGSKKNAPDEWVIIEDVHDPIIDKKTFEQAQTIGQNRKSRHPRELASEFLFSGVLHCAACGSPMHGKTIRSRRKEELTVRRYYRCKEAAQHRCRTPMIREETVEASFLRALREAGSADRELALSVLKNRKHTVPADRREWEKQLAKVAERKKRWQMAYAEGLLDLAEFRQYLQAEQEEAARLQALLQADDAYDAELETRRLEAMQDFGKIWPFARPHEKKHIVSLLVQRMTVAVTASVTHRPRTEAPHLLEVIYH